MPSGTTVTATPSTWMPEPWAISQPERPDAQPVAWGCRVRPRRRGTSRRPRPPGRPGGSRAAAAAPPRSATGDQRASGAAGRRSGRRPVAVGERSGEQRRHGPAIIARRGRRIRAHTPNRHGSRRSGYRGRRHDGARRVRPVLQGRPHPTAAADVLPHRRPPVLPRAVRDAFVVAWHHWRKVSRRRGPRGLGARARLPARPRRHTAKLWHREKDLDPEVKATLDALGRLSMTQRRVLLLTELTTSSLADDGPRGRAAPDRGRARAADRDVDVLAAPRGPARPRSARVLEAVRGHVETNRWPRPTILRRAGATRRRTHTVIGVVGDGGRAGRSPAPWSPTPTACAPPSPASGSRHPARPAPPTPKTVDLPEDAMLGADSVTRLVSAAGGWTVAQHRRQLAGNGQVVCPASRAGTPRPRPPRRRPGPRLRRRSPAAPARPPPRSSRPPRPARTERAAERGFDTAVGWFAGCRDNRAQLLDDLRAAPGSATRRCCSRCAPGRSPTPTIVAGVARTGSFTTTTVTHQRRRQGPEPAAVAKLLGRGVDQLCALPEGGACSTDTRRRADRARCRSAQAPGMLDEVDLPPADRRRPARGSAPSRAGRSTNAAATHCDDTDFSDAADDQQPDPDVPGARRPSCPPSSA